MGLAMLRTLTKTEACIFEWGWHETGESADDVEGM